MRTIRLEVAGATARITLQRPEVLNAGDAEWVADLNEVVTRLTAAPDVRVAVITGAGRAFSTGVDLKALASDAFGLPDFVAWEDAMTAMERMDILFIAAINGHCLGGGLQLALVCDYRLASEEALLGLPAVKECLIPSMSLYRLPRLIGMARARELILLGESITARVAESYGLVNRVVPAAEFPNAVEATVAKLAALPPASVRASKRLLGRAFDLAFDEFRTLMQKEFEGCLASEEHRRAMEALRPRAVGGRRAACALQSCGRRPNNAATSWSPMRAKGTLMREHVERIIEFLEVERFRKELIANLPFGIQKLVGIGRALAVAPTLLLLDEPFTGMNREEKENLARLMLRIKHELGTTMLWIEHDMELVADLADTVTVLDFGEKIAEGPPDIILRDPRVAEAYLGRAYIAEKGSTT